MPSEPFKICPRCNAHRPISELFCGNVVKGDLCNWSLYHEEIRETSDPKDVLNSPQPDSSALVCRNGHPSSPGDLICPICNEELTEAALGTDPEPAPPENRRIGDWHVLEERSVAFQNQQQFVVTRDEDASLSLLTLYKSGCEPDALVYNILRKFSRDHVPELKDTGHWQGRAFEVSELLSGGSVREIQIDRNGIAAVEAFVREVSRILADFSEAGLRHRDIRPETILVRSRTPLDLVVCGFGSARLSDLDLEIAAPLETGRYTAPETLMGGVSAASDWWGLGMILLEKLTNGECFAGADDQLFMIHVITHGVTIPDDFPPRITNLLRGLLAVDRTERWQWKQVREWLHGNDVPVPDSRSKGAETTAGPSIRLGGRDIRDVVQFTLAAARAANWDEASGLLERGTIAGWGRELNVDSRTLSAMEQLTSRADVSSDFRLAIALQLLNSALPIICRESIVSPAWLLQDPERGFDLLSGPVPDLLIRFGIQSQAWLLQLAKRLDSVRRRAESLGIQLDDEQFRLCSVISSRAQLVAMWDSRRCLFADANVSGLCSVMDRRSFTEEDLVLLASAALGQFRSVDEVINATIELAGTRGLTGLGLDAEILRGFLQQSRLRLYETLERRTEGFARCNQALIDEWVDGFRMRRRLDIEQLLIVLFVPENIWQKPPHQDYLTSLLSYFEKKVSASVLRGPLVKMAIGKTTARIDVTELADDASEAQSLLERLLDRSDRRFDISPKIFAKEPNPEIRLRRLENHTATYLRDTGVNGLYLGFPFLALNDQPGSRQPRLAPVLLWPVVLKSPVGQRSGFTLAFDRDREEVRLNPAFEALLGLARSNEWRDAAKELLMQQSIRVSNGMDALGQMASVQGRNLKALPNSQALTRIPHNTLIPAAVVFHVEFVGQSLVEDLKQLPGQRIEGTALETMLRIGAPAAQPPQTTDQGLRYFVADSDPSQEIAVAQAFQEKGVVVQGPPGTGKSQTIVNLVSDAIGRQKSVLVVCQKLPALEVVRKRLIANGLQDRICMVTDVKRDRAQIIKEIREQLTGIPYANLFHPQVTQDTRGNLLATIKILENDLNEIHEICQKNRDGYGRSYLSIIDELLAIEPENDSSIPDADGLRRVLKGLNNAEISALEESCTDAGRLWLKSDFENSPYRAVADFYFDESFVSEFASLLQALYESEHSRSQLVAATPDAIDVNDGDAAEEWVRGNQSFFEDLTSEEREELNGDVGWFLDGTAGQQVLQAIEGLLRLRQSQPEACIEVAALQELLQSCPGERLRAYAEFCSDHASRWMESQFTGNPFQQMKDQVFAPASVMEFKNCLEALATAEAHRHKVMQEPFRGRDFESVDSLIQWLDHYGETLSNIDHSSAQRIAALYTLFDGSTPNRSPGETLLGQARRFSETLSKLDLDDYSESIGRMVASISPSEILYWFKAAPSLARRPGLLGWLNPARHLAFRRANQFLVDSGVPPVQDNIMVLGKALLLEQNVQHIRREWKPPLTLASDPESTAISVTDLKFEIESAMRDLQFVQNIITGLRACPVKIRVDSTRLNNPNSFRGLVSLTNQIVRRHQARSDSLAVIDRLRTWMSEQWWQQASEIVTKMVLSDEASVLQRVIEFRGTADSFIEMRQFFRVEGPELARVFEALSVVRDQLERLAAEVPLEKIVSACVIYNGLTVRLSRLRRKMPSLLPKLLESPAELQTALTYLQRVQQVAERILACPCSDSRRMMLLDSLKSTQEFFGRLLNGIQRERARRRSEGAVQEISKWMSEEWQAAFIAAVRSDSVDISQTTALRSALPTLKDFLLFRRRWADFGATQRQCFEEFAKLRRNLASADPAAILVWMKTQIRRTALLAWKTEIENDHPQLLTQRDELDRKIGSLGNALQQLRDVDRSLLTSNFERDSIGSDRDWEGATRLRGARAISLRQFFERGGELGLRSLRPVWMMIPDVVSQLLPRIPGLFDIVIFDEASQMPVEHSLPSLFRAKTVVVSGDEKQMPPSSFFTSRVENDETDDEEDEASEDQLSDQERDAQEESWNRRDIKDCPDLLHLAESILPRAMLQIHYRSKYRELISFSNSAFYRNELSIPVIQPEEKIRNDKPVEFIPVKGVYSKQTNEAEAKRVVAYLEAIWRTSRANCPSVGIVTFNRKQADLVEELLEQRAEQNATFRNAFIRERDRTDHGEDMSLFVKNVENVQGDERDVIIFSTTFGRNGQGIFRKNFGVLGQNGGERRLNVAITRARQKVALVTSMPISDVSDMMNLKRAPSSPRDYLQGYLEYARLVSDGNFEHARRLIGRMSSGRRSEAETEATMTGLQRSVYEFVSSLGFTLIRLEPDPVLGIDFAILNPRTGLFGVGIECSPPNHRLLTTARMREIWRPSLIGSNYQKFVRISGGEWFRNRESEQMRLAAEIRSVIGEGQ
ncbi:DUF4011 domain-containing protein [bacterium]|nr:DUF4011 domain-containing protein [bacterium]